MAQPQPSPTGVIHFPDGLPGFESLRQFVLLQEEELLPIVFLVSLIEPKICLPLAPIHHIRSDYQLRLTEDDRRMLELPAEVIPGLNVLCMAVLNLGDGTQKPSANLLAPIVINPANCTAKQIIQIDSPYSTVTEV
ncbi:MAG TPA: flagellar assembly protein FliW [Bryobacterales bacterium]|jgi:flagellar assembly factor FliW|nr:flagellar assembly protein FliW [Bryobacterales bacterium]